MRSGVTWQLHRGSRVVLPRQGAFCSINSFEQQTWLHLRNYYSFHHPSFLQLCSWFLYWHLICCVRRTWNTHRLSKDGFLGSDVRSSLEKHRWLSSKNPAKSMARSLHFTQLVSEWHFWLMSEISIYFLTLLKQTSSEPSKMQWRTRRESTGWISLLIIVKFMI